MPKIKVNDININYQVNGDGFPVVLINGLGGNMENWRQEPTLLNKLAKDHKTIIFDNRGAGLTDIGDKPYSMRLMADDTIGLMDALGVSKAHILGGSMGGMIAQEIAINYPDRVEKLVLNATWPGGASPHTIRPVEQELWDYLTVKGKGDPTTFSTVNPLLLVFNPKSVAEMDRDEVEAISSTLFEIRELNDGFAGQQIAIRDMDTVDRLKDIKAQTLVVSCKYDILIPPENGVLIAKNLPDSKFILLENSAHASIEDKDFFTETVVEFFR